MVLESITKCIGAFFPQLMAGPIERAKKLMPQIQQRRSVTAAQIREGTWLTLWGLFKKVYIADNLAPYHKWGLTLEGEQCSLGMYVISVSFCIALYCDFSGYSDMARGFSKFFGIELSKNFTWFTGINDICLDDRRDATTGLRCASESDRSRQGIGECK